MAVAIRSSGYSTMGIVGGRTGEKGAGRVGCKVTKEVFATFLMKY